MLFGNDEWAAPSGEPSWLRAGLPTPSFDTFWIYRFPQHDQGALPGAQLADALADIVEQGRHQQVRVTLALFGEFAIHAQAMHLFAGLESGEEGHLCGGEQVTGLF